MKTAAEDTGNDYRVGGPSAATSEYDHFLRATYGEGRVRKRHEGADEYGHSPSGDDDGDASGGCYGSRRPNSDLEPWSIYRENVVVLCFCIVFLMSMAWSISTPPVSAIMEAVICRQHHPEAAIATRSIRRDLLVTEDPLCKGTDVQGELASLRGWAAMVDCVPGMPRTEDGCVKSADLRCSLTRHPACHALRAPLGSLGPETGAGTVARRHAAPVCLYRRCLSVSAILDLLTFPLLLRVTPR